MSNVPKLRFKEFSEEWEKHYFSDIYGFFQTNSFSRALLNYENGSIKNIHYGDIHTKFKSNFFINKEEVPFINTEIDISKIKDENYCQIKDLIIADASEDYNDIGKAIEIIELNGEKLVAGLHTYIARDIKNKMALGFGGYFMQTHNIRLQMMKLATGISVLGISKSNLSNISLVIPSKKEQEKIASFLTSIDTKIEQLTKKEELLQQYKKGVMQKIFNQEIRFKADDGSLFPEWEEKKLEDLLDMVVDNRGKTPPIHNEGIPLIEVNAIGQKEVQYKKVSKYVTSETYNDWFRKYLEDGDILFSTVGQTAICSLYSNNVKACIAQNIVGLRFKEKYFSDFMYYLLTEEKNNFQFKRIEMIAVQPSVKVSQMIHLIFLVPCLEEQIKIANFLSSIDSKIEQVQKQLNFTKKFKKALLQQMFV
ncbi:restriction endonuclease subunit S [Aliarcobacter skirrowii]|uniref:restriction endonuclease subunit S n=1 Tax=Aliarcobacter skirrowii TaxID=28200 RepID=UPI002A359529|nr:restriction endonuclease subunit S [Aliarcobacter skirrowii]MDY0181409.1 restriction endonuclease subunit S [Aliarcobacter skirrowii]